MKPNSDGRQDMDLDKILQGESKNVEYKESLPEKSIKYLAL
jgi:hypothetical protein